MLRSGVWVDSALVGCIVTAAIYWSTNRVSNWFGGYSLYGLVLIWYCRSGIPVSSLVCLLVLVLAYWSMVGDTIFDSVVLVVLRSFVVYEGFLFRLESRRFRCMEGRGCLIYLSLEDTPPMRYPYVYKVLSVSLSLALCWYSFWLKNLTCVLFVSKDYFQLSHTKLSSNKMPGQYPSVELDPQHISCVGGRTIITRPYCAGNAPRYIHTSKPPSTLPLPPNHYLPP